MKRVLRWVAWAFLITSACGAHESAPPQSPATKPDPAAPSAQATPADSPKVQTGPLAVSSTAPEGRDDATGRLDPNVIQTTIRAQYDDMRKCYSDGLGRNASLTGRVVVRFVIERDGSVSRVRDDGSTMPDPVVTECVLKSFYEIRFPKPENGIVTVVYPIKFEPG